MHPQTSYIESSLGAMLKGPLPSALDTLTTPRINEENVTLETKFHPNPCQFPVSTCNMKLKKKDYQVVLQTKLIRTTNYSRDGVHVPQQLSMGWKEIQSTMSREFCMAHPMLMVLLLCLWGLFMSKFTQCSTEFLMCNSVNVFSIHPSNYYYYYYKYYYYYCFKTTNIQ